MAMPGEKVPRILSPNLGCPLIVSPEVLVKEGIDCVLAGGQQDFDPEHYHVSADGGLRSAQPDRVRDAVLPADHRG
jgi:hypothetical protein